MELNQRTEAPSFGTVHTRLLVFVNARIRNGELSERALAKLVGVSQPHLHNVLKGERKLHSPLADALLACFRISLLDLLSTEELHSGMHPRAPTRYMNAGILPLRLLRKPMNTQSTTTQSHREVG